MSRGLPGEGGLLLLGRVATKVGLCTRDQGTQAQVQGITELLLGGEGTVTGLREVVHHRLAQAGMTPGEKEGWGRIHWRRCGGTHLSSGTSARLPPARLRLGTALGTHFQPPLPQPRPQVPPSPLHQHPPQTQLTPGLLQPTQPMRVPRSRHSLCVSHLGQLPWACRSRCRLPPCRLHQCKPRQCTLKQQALGVGPREGQRQ